MKRYIITEEQIKRLRGCIGTEDWGAQEEAHDVLNSLPEPPSPVEAEACEMPAMILFFPNGQTAVGDRRGQQMPKYQRGHAESIALLAADGIDWRQIPEIHGSPITIKPERE